MVASLDFLVPLYLLAHLLMIKKNLQDIRLAIIIFFLLLITIRIYLDISLYESFRLSNIIVPVIIILTLLYKSKMTWLAAVLLFISGIYYYLFERIWIAYPGKFDFTFSLIELSKLGYCIRNTWLIHFITLFPLAFF